MAYATQSDITDLYSADALYVADRDGDGTVETEAVTRALEQASDEIDSYLAVRYRLPLPEVPGILRQIAVDFALYRLALSRDVLSDEHRRRYEDGRDHLKRIADGRAALHLPSLEADPDGDGEGDGPTPVVRHGPERLFSRDKMRGL
jgi:phage gp36-like protein